MKVRSNGGLTVANKTIKKPLGKVVRNQNKQNVLSKSNIDDALTKGKRNKIHKNEV